MKIRERDIPIVLLILWLLVWNFGITEFQTLYPVDFLAWCIRMISLIYAIVLLGKSSKIKKSLFGVYIGVILFLLYLCVKSGNTRYFDTVFFALFLRNVDYKKLLRIGSYTQFTIILITVLSSMIGLIPNEQVFNAGRIRYNLGFIYCSYSANMLFFAIACLIASFSNERRLKVKEAILLGALNYLIFWYTDTKASFWGTLFLLILACGISPNIPTKRWIRFKTLLAASIVPLFSVVSIFISLFYDASNPIHALCNAISSGRIYMGYVGLKKYGITLWGSNIEWATDHTTTYFYVDSSYINILLTMGLVALFLISFGFARTGYYAVQLGDRKMVLVILFVAIHCLFDPQLLDLRYDLLILTCFSSFVVELPEEHDAYISNLAFRRTNITRRRD